jgi:hypothetical protein
MSNPYYKDPYHKTAAPAATPPLTPTTPVVETPKFLQDDPKVLPTPSKAKDKPLTQPAGEVKAVPPEVAKELVKPVEAMGTKASWCDNIRTAIWTNEKYPVGDRSVPWDEPCSDCGQPAGEHFVNLNGRSDDKAIFPRCPRDAHAEGPRHKGEPAPLPVRPDDGWTAAE